MYQESDITLSVVFGALLGAVVGLIAVWLPRMFRGECAAEGLKVVKENRSGVSISRRREMSAGD